MSLKRSAALDEGPHPRGIQFLETLFIFSWNADYIEQFQNMLDHEGIAKPCVVPVERRHPWPERKLPIPQPKHTPDRVTTAWTLDDSGPDVKLDLSARLVLLESRRMEEAIAGRVSADVTIDFRQDAWMHVLDMHRLYLDLLEYKAVRGYDHVYIDPSNISRILRRRCTIQVSGAEKWWPEQLQTWASQALQRYMDRFVRMKEREAESRNVEPAYLACDDPRLLQQYVLRVKPGEWFNKIEALLQAGLPRRDDGEPIPRLYMDESLLNPMLMEGGTAWKTSVSVSPPALHPNEAQFLRDLREYWQMHHHTPELRPFELYVLRNLSRTGIGLFHRSGFYPDFILWLYDQQTEKTNVCFVDPHGLHHDGLEGTLDKFEALRALQSFNQQREFREKKIAFSGFILTRTPLEAIKDAGGKTKKDLEEEYPLIFQEGSREYVDKMVKKIISASSAG